MNADTILANPDIIRLESFISEPNAITIVIHSKQKRPLCPNCHQPSSSVHSHYRRVPWHNVAVKLQLHTRRVSLSQRALPAEDILRKITWCSWGLRSQDLSARRRVNLAGIGFRRWSRSSADIAANFCQHPNSKDEPEYSLDLIKEPNPEYEEKWRCS